MEKFVTRVKRLSDPSKKPRDRFLVLPTLSQEGFSASEISDFFQQNDALILSVYLDFMRALDAEAENVKSPKFCTTAEMTPIGNVLRTLIVSNREKIRQGWEADKIEEEVFCFLHVDNHNSIRRLGLDVLLHYIEAIHPEPEAEAHFNECVFERVRIFSVLSAFDWDLFREGLNATMPSTIVQIRESRHKTFPTRVRSIAAVDEEREKEATDALKFFYDFILHRDGPKLRNWWLMFRSHLAPIIYPTESFSSGAIPQQRWEGFSNGAPASFHYHTLQFLMQLDASEKLRSLTLLGSPIDCKFTITVAGATFATVPRSDRKSIVSTNTLYSRWMSEKPKPLSSCLDEPIAHILRTNDIRSCLKWLQDACLTNVGTATTATASSTAAPTSSMAFHDNNGGGLASPATTDSVLMSVFMHQVETMVDLLRSVVVDPSNYFVGETKVLAMKQLISTVESAYGFLSQHQHTQNVNLNPVKDVLIFTSQAFWDAAFSLCPPGTPGYEKLVTPLTHALGPLVRSSVKSSYFHNCWLSQLVHITDGVVCANGSKNLNEFHWPTATMAQEGAGTDLQMFRANRQCPAVIIDYVNARSKDSASMYRAFSAALHSTFASLADDVFSVRIAKGWTLCKSCKHFINAASDNYFTVEPNSILSMIIPYLMLVTQTREPGHGSSAALHAVAIEAFETIASLLSMPTSAPVNDEIFIACMNTIVDGVSKEYTDPNLGQREPHPTELVIRVMNRLFSGNCTSTQGTPTPSCFSLFHRCIPSFRGTIYDISTYILSLPTYKDETQLLEAKVAAFTVLMWKWNFVYQENVAKPGDDANTARAALTEYRRFERRGIFHIVKGATKFRHPNAQLIRALTFFLVTDISLCPSIAAVPTIAGEDGDDVTPPMLLHVSLMNDLLKLFMAQWTTLSEKNAILLFAGHIAFTEALIVKGAGKPLAPDMIACYSQLLLTLIANCFFHMFKWRVTKTHGQAIILLLRSLTETVARVGHLSYQPEGFSGVTLGQLLCDLVSYCSVGQCTLRYNISLPASPQDPLRLYLYVEEDSDEDFTTVPPLDGKVWMPQGPLAAEEEKDDAHVADVKAAAAAMLQMLLTVTGNEERQNPVSEAIPENEAGDYDEEEDGPQIAKARAFALNRATALVVSQEDRDGFHALCVDGCIETAWSVRVRHGEQPQLPPPSAATDTATLIGNLKPSADGDQQEGAGCGAFSTKPLSPNLTLDSMLEDFTSTMPIPRELQQDCMEPLSDEMRGNSLLRHAPYQPQPRPENPTASAATLLFSSLGQLGVGDVHSRSKPLTASMRPQTWFAHCSKTLVKKVQEVHPVVTHHVAVSGVSMNGENEAGVRSLLAEVAGCLGWTVDGQTDVHDYTAPGIELQTTVISNSLNVIPSAKLPIHIVCASSFAAVSSVRHQIATRADSQQITPCSIVYVIEQPDRHHYITYLQKVSNVPLTGLVDGMMYPKATLAPLLHATIRIANDAFLRLLPTSTPFHERFGICAEPEIGGTGKCFASFLPPFFQGAEIQSNSPMRNVPESRSNPDLTAASSTSFIQPLVPASPHPEEE